MQRVTVQIIESGRVVVLLQFTAIALECSQKWTE
jgi:hypothetical protein